ncbi:MAG: hypothetical protein KDA28_03045, partial [Phycisphaerales bacterium]|nr:hypothetical protein [Phycisphaerales bacterium]
TASSPPATPERAPTPARPPTPRRSAAPVPRATIESKPAPESRDASPDLAPPVAPPRDAPPVVTSDDPGVIWRAVTERTTSRALRTVLADTVLQSLASDVATIESGPAMESLLLQHASEVERLLREVTGRVVRLEITQRAPDAPAPAPVESEESIDHPLVDKAMHLFGDGGNV